MGCAFGRSGTALPGRGAVRLGVVPEGSRPIAVAGRGGRLWLVIRQLAVVLFPGGLPYTQWGPLHPGTCFVTPVSGHLKPLFVDAPRGPHFGRRPTTNGFRHVESVDESLRRLGLRCDDEYCKMMALLRADRPGHAHPQCGARRPGRARSGRASGVATSAPSPRRPCRGPGATCHPWRQGGLPRVEVTVPPA